MRKWITRIIRSRTMMFNLFMALITSLEGSFGLLQPYLPGNVFAYTTVILIVGNQMFRALTTKALRDK